MSKSEKNILVLIIIIGLLLLTYKRFFNKNDETVIIDDNNQTINDDLSEKGTEIYQSFYLKFLEDRNVINKKNNYVIFRLSGENIIANTLEYKIIINNRNNPNKSFSFDLVELDDKNNEKNRLVNNNIFDSVNNNVIYSDSVLGLTKIDKKYKLQINDYDMYNIDYTDDIIVNVTFDKEVVSLPVKEKGHDILLKAISTRNMCNSTWTDNDGTIYFSGDNDCVNYNYVWYSGKLWRIVAVYPDGIMKLVTDDMITTINWGRTIDFNNSWVYQWLNEDFYDTLENSVNVVSSSNSWYYDSDSNRVPIKPSGNLSVVAPVGLLSSYEYYNAGRNTTPSNNYLNNNHYWWHITPYKDGGVRSTGVDGKQDLNIRTPKDYARGIRPSIYLKSDVCFDGDGTKSNPYVIADNLLLNTDKSLLNSHISGEYLMFNNDLYRIVSVIDNKTKIIRVDYLKAGNKVINKHIASTINYGSSTNIKTEEYWDYYLNNIWYNSISTQYREMIVDGTFYLGSYNKNTHYKQTICSNGDLDNVKVENCNKYTDRVYIGKIGLSRIGEMFSAQDLHYNLETVTFWTLTPFDNAENRIVLETNALYHHLTYGGFHAVRPVFYLDSSVKVTNGNGMFNNPYMISK